MGDISRGKKIALLASQRIPLSELNNTIFTAETEKTKHKRNSPTDDYSEFLKKYLELQTVTSGFLFTKDSLDLKFDSILRSETFQFVKQILEDVITEALNNVVFDIQNLQIVDENFQPLVCNVEQTNVAQGKINIISIEITKQPVKDLEVIDEEVLEVDKKTDSHGSVGKDLFRYTLLKKRKKFCSSKKERIAYLIENKKKAHSVKPSCQCKKQCSKKFTETRRQDINMQYWDLNFKEKRVFISSHVEVKNVERRRSPNENILRQYSLNYSLQDVSNTRQSVCKKFFLATLGFSHNNDSVLKYLTDKDVLIKKDQRGISARKSKLDRDIIQSHIKSFSPSVSHYRREHAPKKLYVPSDITIAKMHEDFINQYNKKISYEVYRKEVTEGMNISFTRLGHEECERCEVFQLHNKNHTRENLNLDCDICIHWKTHIERAKASREKYREDCDKYKTDKNSVYYAADMQKIIMLPRLEMFKTAIFTTRLIAFNESFVPIGNLKKNLPFIVLWHEGISGRKRENVASTFYNFLTFTRDITDVTIWLDNCAGQNKNWCLFSLLVLLINSTEISTSTITLKYFEPGHTFMSCDSFHHQVELGLKKHPKVYDFEDFVNVVRKCNSNRNIIKEMKFDDFRNWPDLSSAYQLQKMMHNKDRPLLKDICIIRARRGFRHLFYHTDFDGPEKEIHFVGKKFLKNELTFPEKVKCARGITTCRKNAILKNLSPIIPPHKLQFWSNLVVNDEAPDLTQVVDDI